ncbi:hypothetical protein [Luteimonas abyssi]|uniref:hypothetical protein n=1 Tax=Luteimonas abyssi TaxID=1247514 RepID=UPI000AFD25D2|nr:hypothetical protein [Luteimonas abyssi]
MVKQRRLTKPQDIKKLITEQINILRQNEDIDPIKKANAIGYLSNVFLGAYKDGEAAERLEAIEKQLEELKR